MKKGFSLIEVLVVLTLFGILGVIMSQAVLLTLVGTRKSDSSIRVRENVDFAVKTMERQLHNAIAITDGDCDGSTQKSVINYEDQEGLAASFSCENIGGSDPYVASSSARLTSDTVTITSCSFVCIAATGNAPPFVTIALTAEDAISKGAKGSTVQITTDVVLRAY